MSQPILPKDEPKWLVYEKAIADLEAKYKNCQVFHDHKVKGRRSQVVRQVDVWLEVTVGHGHALTVAVECRHYQSGPVGIKDVDAFYGFLDDLGANKGVIISSSGFTEGAEARADGSNVELKTLSLEEAQDFDWAEYVSDSCEVDGCWGWINWTFQDGDSEAGYCNSCGTLHIRCGSCGTTEVDPSPVFEEGGSVGRAVFKCSDADCGMRWELGTEKGDYDSFTELPPDEEDDTEEEQEEDEEQEEEDDDRGPSSTD